MKNIIPPVKGTRDYYPEEMAVRSWLYTTVQKVSESFGYQEYEAPILETLELYAAKSSEELVKKQSFAFADRGGDWLTLRPELTPSLARMIAQRQEQLTYPLRWWSFGPFWRYEAPQKGRTREFFQWNIDLIGVDSPQADAEMIALVAEFFREVGLKPDQATILINDRQLTNQQFVQLGVPPEIRQDALGWLDRRDKMKPEEWIAYGMEIGLSAVQVDQMITYLADPERWQDSPTLTAIFSALEWMGANEFIRYDPGIIRGLPYYTGLVFEAFDVRGSVKRAILGGGRYNNLMAAVGGSPLPAVGFAMGDLVISLILKELGLLPGGTSVSPASVLVTLFNAEGLPDSLAFAMKLRRAGLKVSCYPEAAKLPKQFKYADRMGIRIAAVIGPDEAAQGQITLKDLITGTQQTLPQAHAVQYIENLLAAAKPS